MRAAQQASTLDPTLGEAWAVLGYLLSAAGRTDEGQAAARRATALEPENWRHHYRLAYGSWGEERLRAVDRTLALMPGFAPARMLACMVFVARGTMDRAEREASIGAEAQRQNQADQTPLPAVGFHWLRGMILAAEGDHDGALACFAEEIAAARQRARLCARVCGERARRDRVRAVPSSAIVDGASASFAAALADAPGHPKASVGMYAMAAGSNDRHAIDRCRDATVAAIDELKRSERHAEAALVAAGAQIVDGKPVMPQRPSIACSRPRRQAPPAGSFRSIRCWPRSANTPQNMRFSPRLAARAA